MEPVRYYKVLRESKSFNGGKQAWPLPTQTQPGAWLEMPDSDVDICHKGFHLTDEPSKWWKPGCEVFLAEPGGKIEKSGGDKIACSKVRLLKKVTAADVANGLGVAFLRGEPEEWMLHAGYGYGYGYGDGDGDGSGSGDGSGYGSGYGDGDGSGSGYGSGYGSGDGSGSGSGYGSGYGSGDGSGSGYGDGSGDGYGYGDGYGDGSGDGDGYGYGDGSGDG